MDPFVAASIRALELSGYGLHLGPVIDDAPDPLSLGSILVDDQHQDRLVLTVGTPLTMAFDPLQVTNSGLIDLCASSACTSTAFVAGTTGLANGWSSDTFYRVTDVTDDCLRLGLPACRVDRSLTPIQTQSMQDARTGALESVPDADRLLRILSRAPRPSPRRSPPTSSRSRASPSPRPSRARSGWWSGGTLALLGLRSARRPRASRRS